MEFVNPEAVATPQWLAGRLGDPTIKVVDTRYTVEMDEHGRLGAAPRRDSYLEAHIPGAVFLSLDDLRGPDEPAHILQPEAFVDVMSRLGIGNEDEVVVYDTEGGTWAARLWWAMRLYGHDTVRILDGGFANWAEMGLPEETGEPTIEPARFVAGLYPGLRVEMENVLAAIGEPGTVLVDALPEPFYTGQIPLYRHLRAGHIPGARNVPAPANLDPATWRLLPVEQLVDLWAPVIGDAESIVTYCGAGVYAAFDLFVLHLLGHDATLYDGSWEEWGAADDLPVETGPDRTRSDQP